LQQSDLDKCFLTPLPSSEDRQSDSLIAMEGGLRPIMRSKWLSTSLMFIFSAITLCAEPMVSSIQHSIYGPLWQAGPGRTTDLILEGNGRSISVSITIYSPQGSILGSGSVTVKGQGVSRLSLSSLLPQETTVSSGSLSLAWNGPATAVRGTVQLNDDRGISASYLLHGGLRSDTQNALFAPWYLPSTGSSGQIQLFNSGSADINVQVGIFGNGAEKAIRTLAIQSKATESVDLKSLLAEASEDGQTAGSLVLRYTGPTHSLQPSLLLCDPASGFALMPEFSPVLAAGGGGETAWQFPDVINSPAAGPNASEGPISYVLISNGGGEATTVQFRAYSLKGKKTVQGNLQPTNLGPYETKLVSLSEVKALLSPTAGHIGLTVSHSGNAGKVGISIFSVDRNGRTVAVPNGLVISTLGPEVTYWSARASRVVHYAATLPTGGSPFVTLYYQSSNGVGSYTFAQRQAPEGASRIEFTLPPQPSVSDAQGRVFPAGVSSGLLILSAGPETAEQLAARQPNCAADCIADDTALISAAPVQAKAASFSAFVEPADATDPNCPCHADLYYRPVYKLGINTGKTHTFWHLINFDGTYWVIDAGPTGNCFPNCGYLTAWITPGYVGHYSADDSRTASYWWTGGTQVQVGAIFDYEELFTSAGQANTVLYYPISGPNSNTFIHWSANSAGLAPPMPPNAQAW